MYPYIVAPYAQASQQPAPIYSQTANGPVVIPPRNHVYQPYPNYANQQQTILYPPPISLGFRTMNGIPENGTGTNPSTQGVGANNMAVNRTPNSSVGHDSKDEHSSDSRSESSDQEESVSQSTGDSSRKRTKILYSSIPATQILVSKEQEGIFWPKELKIKEPKSQAPDEVKTIESGRWTTKEDEMLLAAVKKFNARNWREIAKMVPGRDFTQCSQRWKKVLDPNVRKGQWSRAEDELLLSIVSKMQIKHWGVAAKMIKGRSAKQCRERYKGHLDPNLSKNTWSPEEDNILLLKYEELGQKWSAIARCVPGRTDNQVKARIKSLLRSRKNAGDQETKSSCSSSDPDSLA